VTTRGSKPGGATTVLGKNAEDREAVKRGSADLGAANLSVISKEMHVEGDCTTEGRLRVEGHITGNVTANGIELLSSGSVDGDVSLPKDAQSPQTFVIGGRVAGAVRATHVEVQRTGQVQSGVFADEAVIHGHVHGGVLARKRLALEETAEVEGDVHARRLALKEGGRVNGTIRMGELAAEGPGGKQATGTKATAKAPLEVAAAG
jgi:cytoskeletal protein CcmA (bactofilin family)